MERDKKPSEKPAAESAAPANQKRPYRPPRVLWVEKLQTLAYECAGGPAPGSNLGCPVG
jgi:hypothetical protein